MNINIHDAVVIAQLNCAFSWGTITDKKITEEVNADKGSTRGSVRARKTLLPAAAGTAVALVQEACSKFYTYHTSRTLATGVKGQRLLPTAFYLDYMTEFGAAEAEVDSAMSALESAYPEAIKEAQVLLGAAFDPADYPPVQELREYLAFRVRFLPMPQGNAIMNALGAAAAADVDSYVQDAVKLATDEAADRLRTCVKNMAERLSNPKAIFRDTLTSNLDDVVKLLPTLNIGNDPMLAEMVERARDTLSGHNPEQLRKNTADRLRVASAANDILKRMGGA